MGNKTKCYCGHTIYCDCPSLEEDKEATLEDAAEKYSLELLESKTIQPHEKTWIKSMFIHIAKWQQEQNKNLYSEEDLLKFGAFVRIEDKKEKRLFLIQDYFKKWFENHKKK